jgi:hypothetical protein
MVQTHWGSDSSLTKPTTSQLCGLIDQMDYFKMALSQHDGRIELINGDDTAYHDTEVDLTFNSKTYEGQTYVTSLGLCQIS